MCAWSPITNDTQTEVTKSQLENCNVDVVGTYLYFKQISTHAHTSYMFCELVLRFALMFAETI